MHNPRNTIPIFEIQSKRSRLLTSAAARLRSTDFPRLPHCLGRFAPCGFSRPPALRRADYRCQSADADLPSSKPVSSIFSVLFLQNRHLLYICGEIKRTMGQIIGRTREIAELNALYQSTQAQLVAIYVRRRVGKTFL